MLGRNELYNGVVTAAKELSRLEAGLHEKECRLERVQQDMESLQVSISRDKEAHARWAQQYRKEQIKLFDALASEVGGVK